MLLFLVSYLLLISTETESRIRQGCENANFLLLLSAAVFCARFKCFELLNKTDKTAPTGDT